MPPKRRAAAAPPPPKAPAPRTSKLAKENNINGAQEHEIKEAFALFQSSDSKPKDPFMPTLSVRRALAALNLSTSAADLRELLDAADPENEGIVSYEAFLGIAALQMKMQEKEDEDEDEEMNDEEEDDYAGRRKGKGKAKTNSGRGQRGEIEHAFKLFTGVKDGQPVPALITLPMLRRVAKEIKEEISDEMLLNMLKEASGGISGVNVEDFEGIMRRAGVFR